MELNKSLKNLIKAIKDGQFCWDELKDCAEACLGELREAQACYIDGLADDDAELKNIESSIDVLDGILKQFENIG